MTDARKMRLVVLIGLVLISLWVGVEIAAATEGECAAFENHSGHVPGSYDYAEFYEDGQLVVTVETNGEDIFVNPAQYDAGQSWDQVKKCHNGTTTTTEVVTTTTEATTSTTEQATTTTAPAETTTVPGEDTSTTVPSTTTQPAPTTTMDICESEGEVPDHCLPPPTTTPDAPELPFTGVSGTMWLLLGGAATLGLGVSAVRASRRFSE